MKESGPWLGSSGQHDTAVRCSRPLACSHPTHQTTTRSSLHPSCRQCSRPAWGRAGRVAGENADRLPGENTDCLHRERPHCCQVAGRCVPSRQKLSMTASSLPCPQAMLPAGLPCQATVGGTSSANPASKPRPARLTSQPAGLAALLFCASCTTDRISASDCKAGAVVQMAIVSLRGHNMWQQPCQKAPQCVLRPLKRRAQLAPSWHPAHLAARGRHAHVVIHLFDPRRQVLHVPRVVLDLVDRDALGGVCGSTQ